MSLLLSIKRHHYQVDWIAVISYTGQYDTVGKLIVQHNIKRSEQPIAISVSRRQQELIAILYCDNKEVKKTFS